MAARLAAMLALAAAVAGCATTGLRQWDPVFQGHDGLTVGVPAERMGVLFGSVAIPAEEEGAIGSVSLHLRAAGAARDDILIVAANRFHMGQRAPDIATARGKVWVFSGQLPEGEYFIQRAGLSRKATPAVVEWIRFGPAIPVSVKASGSVYLGRWQPHALRLADLQVPSPALVWLGDFRLYLSDALHEDQDHLERKRLAGKGIPVSVRTVDNPLQQLKALQRSGTAI